MKAVRNWISILLFVCLGLAGIVPTGAWAAMTISLTSPTSNQVFTASASVTASATVTGTSTLGTLAKVAFYRGTTMINTAETSSPYSTIWTSAPAGSYSITAVAMTSTDVVLATSPVVAIIVNAPPTVVLTSPTPNQGFSNNNTSIVTLTATATSSSGTISKVDFYQGSTLIGTATSTPYSVSWSNLPGVFGGSSYSLTAVATDSNGIAATSAAVSILVDDAVYMYDLGDWGLMAQQLNDQGDVIPDPDANGDPKIDANCHLHLRQYWDPRVKPAGGYHPMFYIHGGSFVFGRDMQMDRSWDGDTPSYRSPNKPSAMDDVLNYFVSKGYMVTMADYRLLRAKDGASDGTYATGASSLGFFDADCKPATTAELKHDVKMDFGLAGFMNGFHDDEVALTERMLIVGDSAGGHLAVWLANQLSADDKNHVAVFADAGVYDFTNIWMQANALSNGLNGVTSGGWNGPNNGITTAPRAFDAWAYSATHTRAQLELTTVVDANIEGAFVNLQSAEVADNTFQYKNKVGLPPIYLAHGIHDDLVPAQQAIRYCASLAANLDIPASYTIPGDPDAGHRLYACNSNSILDLVVAGTNYNGDDRSGHDPSYKALFDRVESWFAPLR